jgi:hypothetical protein
MRRGPFDRFQEIPRNFKRAPDGRANGVLVMQHKSSWYSLIDRFAIALRSPDGNRQTGPFVSLPEKSAAEGAIRVESGILCESGFSAKYAELRAFRESFSGNPQSFSAVQTCWRRELNSNSEYRFKLWRKSPSVSSLPALHPRSGRTGETNWARPLDRVVRFL